MAQSAKAIATTVGPYLKYGLPLVEACAAAGTHYADLTGETLFMRRAIDAAHDAAVASGARIVHTCGFDSIPSDLGVFLLHEYAKATRPRRPRQDDAGRQGDARWGQRRHDRFAARLARLKARRTRAPARSCSTPTASAPTARPSPTTATSATPTA